MNLGGVTLVNNLDYKIRIAKLQKQTLIKNSYPLITINLRYLKNKSIYHTRKHILDVAISAISDALKEKNIEILEVKQLNEEEFPIAMITPKFQHVTMLKKMMMAIENCHPLGPIMDINVMGVDGMSITRRSSGMPPRDCLICGEAISVCRLRGNHTNKEYLDAINELILNEKFSY